MPDVRIADVSIADRAEREDARGPVHIRMRPVRLRRDHHRPVQLNVLLIRVAHGRANSRRGDCWFHPHDDLAIH
jgi:hypothetical protein